MKLPKLKPMKQIPRAGWVVFVLALGTWVVLYRENLLSGANILAGPNGVNLPNLLLLGLILSEAVVGLVPFLSIRDSRY
jgi:hypothetical protein